MTDDLPPEGPAAWGMTDDQGRGPAAAGLVMTDDRRSGRASTVPEMAVSEPSTVACLRIPACSFAGVIIG